MILEITIFILLCVISVFGAYISWLRHQLKNTIRTNNGLYSQLNVTKEINLLLTDKALVQKEVIENLQDTVADKTKTMNEVADMIGESTMKNREKINIISRLKCQES